jgi:hypothetical protein
VNSFSGHSLRAGFVTSAAHPGEPERRIMRQTGHKSIEIVLRYVRQANVYILPLARPGLRLRRQPPDAPRYKCRQHRAKLVNGQRIVAVYQRMPAPLADPHYEHFDLEIGGCLPLTEHLKDPFLGFLVLHRRTLRASETADHVFHLLHLQKDLPITTAQVYILGERALGNKPPLVDLSVFEVAGGSFRDLAR